MTTKTPAQTMHQTRIDIPEAARVELVALLNKTLAATVDLKTQVKQAHWNVKGWDFFQLHQLFDEIAGEIEEYSDTVAERITTLGGYAMGTVRAVAHDSFLPEYPFSALGSVDHLNALAERLASYAKHLRDAIARADELGDAGTADLFTEVSRAVDKRLWFIEAHLQGN